MKQFLRACVCVWKAGKSLVATSRHWDHEVMEIRGRVGLGASVKAGEESVYFEWRPRTARLVMTS